MLEKILHISLAHRWVVLCGVVLVAIGGIFAFQQLPIDALPDITNVQVQVNTEAPGYSPFEIERRITLPLETSLAGLVGVEYTRSISRYGLSQITVVFKDGTDIYFARQVLNERLTEAKGQIPVGIEPKMGPIATGLGEIYMWVVEALPNAVKSDGTEYSLSDLRTIEDWIVKPQLKTLEGVADINTIGGYEKQYHITPYPEKLQAYGVTFDDLLRAIELNNSNIGAGYIEHNGKQYLVRVPAQLNDENELKLIVISEHEGIPLRIQDVAEVAEGKELRTGAATENGKEIILGTVFMRIGENSREVSQRVDRKLKEINSTLPEGVIAKTVYNRTSLVNATINTVRNNLIEGAILVIAILFLFLGNIRAALITTAVIPLSMLFTIIGMTASNVSGNLLSLGALDFGIIVDGSLIIVENCIRRLAEAQHSHGRELSLKERMDIVFDASKEVRKATMFGEAIIMVVYIPILTLTGVEGKMFYPMAFTVVLALLAAMILSVTFVPAAVAAFLKGRIIEKELFIVRWSKRLYRPVLDYSLRHKAIPITIASVLILLSGIIVLNMGSEFLPELDEGDMAIHGLRIPGTSLTQAVQMQDAMEKALIRMPEVDKIFSKIGTAEIATDPMPPSVADVFVIMKPRENWPNPQRPKEEIISEMDQRLKRVPGSKYEFLQPIQMRFNELIAGIRSDLGIKIFGDDMEQLNRTAQQIAKVVSDIDGAADVEVEQVTGLPILTVHLDKEAIARYGLTASAVQNVVEVAVGGKYAGQIYEGDRRFNIIVRLPESIRQNIEGLGNLQIPLGSDRKANKTLFSNANETASQRFHTIPLRSVATIEIVQGPNQISRENGKRLVTVTANVRGRDLGTFVEEAQHSIQSSVVIPSGYWLSWGGQFEQLISASNRLMIVVPLALFLVFLLLYGTFRSIKDALLIFTGVPLAVTGGIIALWMRGIPLSISAGVGFIALSGMAVLNGLVMVSFIRQKRAMGATLNDAIYEGAVTRLRPVLMTALVASFGFIPMAVATSIGAEVQRPLATVVIGGIISSALLTLFILPTLYHVVYKKKTMSDSIDGIESNI